jgi:hypothetical protein
LLIGGKLLLVHVTGTDRSQQNRTATPSHGESEKDGPSLSCSADSQKPVFTGGMFQVGENEHVAVKNALDPVNRQAVFLTFRAISGVPVKPVEFYFGYICFCICNSNADRRRFLVRRAAIRV